MVPPNSTVLALLALLAGCATSNTLSEVEKDPGALRPADPDGDGSGSTPGGGDDGTDGSGGTDDGSGGSGGDSGTPGSGDDTGGGAPAQVVRFVAIGDAGTGSDTQYKVGQAMVSVCATHGCDFALYLGDNFYSDGVSSVDDSQFEEKFEAPYRDLNFPFYAVLGNHDYGGNGGGYDVYRTDAEVEYTNHSEKWVMPDQFYTHQHGDITFFGLDTTALDWGNTDEQAAWLPGALAGANTTWKIAYGHHPYVSNGDHGNANNNFGPFVEDHLCGQVDVYLSGHDHELQWLEPTCGTEFMVSGAGAKLTGLGGNNATFFEQETNGFVWIEIDGRTFTGVYYDSDGNELFRRSFTK